MTARDDLPPQIDFGDFDFGDFDFGPVDETPDQFEAGLVARLPELLRERFVCEYDPGSLDHGHTDCYYAELAAREIDRLRALIDEAGLS